jgi:nucleoside-diphosphate-sugar epimerase
VKVLIIGGTGLISTAMTRGFVERGDEVTLFNRGKSDAAIPAGVRQLQGDRTDLTAFEAGMAEAGSFDCVIDMICYRPEEAESLVRAFAGRTGHLIVCSTVDVYAKPASRYPIREDEPHAPPAWDYAQNKEECEVILRAAHERGAVPVTIIRPAFTYGEGRGLVHSFGGRTTHLDRLRKGKPIVVHGDGSSLWTACHRDDVARSFVKAAGCAITFGKSYHVTGEEWMTWNQYHERIAAAMGAPRPTLVHIPTDLLAAVAPRRANICAINFQHNNIFDNAAAHADLEFAYTVRFDAGVRRIVAWLDERGRMEDSDQDPFDDRVIAAWERLGARMRDEAASFE